MRVTLNDDEAEVLKTCLDFTCSRLDERLNGTVMDKVDGYAIRLMRTKVSRLREKLYPRVNTGSAAS